MAAGQATHTRPGAGECPGCGGRENGGYHCQLTSQSVWEKGIVVCLSGTKQCHETTWLVTRQDLKRFPDGSDSRV